VACSALKMEMIRSPETSVNFQRTSRYIEEDRAPTDRSVCVRANFCVCESDGKRPMTRHAELSDVWSAFVSACEDPWKG
jgi:hypothetical protein